MSPEPRVHRFGPFVLDVPNRQLLRDGEELHVRGRAFDVLVVLVERPGQLVTKDDLLDAVWSELAVEENNLQVQVSSLRRLLGPGWIVTVPGRGYRFAGSPAPSAHTAPTESRTRPATQVPEPVSPLVGREADVAEVAGALREHRLVALVGPGGVGKTRVAQAVGRAVMERFRDGCAWIDLAANADPLLTAEGTASALGVAFAGEAAPGEALVQWLRPREMLLIFDNAEHVVDALAPLVARILAAAAGVRVLVTSQRPTRVSGERVHRLDPLELPGAGARVEDAAKCASVALFVARARAQVGDFRLDDRNVGLVVDLCRRLDGVPLALELAAGRLPALGLEGLSRRLEQRFRILTAGSLAAPTRQQDLEALFDWSYGLLGPEEQALFRRLGLLGSSFTLEQALAVACDDGLDEWAVVEMLGDLVDRSLVLATSGDTPEYSLLETGRTYARSRLEPATESASVMRAIRWFEEHGVRAAAASNNAEALRACSAALELVPLLPAGADRDARELDLCLAIGPVIQTTVGPAHARAETVYRRASELANALPPGKPGFMAMWGWWQFLSMSGRDREAAPLCDAIVQMASVLGDDSLELEAHHARMTTQQLLGNAPRVVENAERVIARYDRERHHPLGFQFGGHDPGVCALGQGAVGLWLSGHPDAAAGMAARALRLGGSMEHAYSRGVALFYVSFLWCGLENREGLRDTSAALFELCERHAMDMLSNEALLLRGRARWEAGDTDLGIDDMQRALDTIDRGGDFAFAMFYAALLVEALLASERFDEAARRIERAAAYAREGQGFFRPEVIRLRGVLGAMRGDPDGGAARFREALELGEGQGAVALALRAASSATQWARPAGRGAARRQLRSVLARVDGGGETADVRRARRLLERSGSTAGAG